MQSYTIGQAARLLGVSPDTARRWADAGRVTTHRDESGRRLIDGRDLAAFSVELAKSVETAPDSTRTSVRNAFPGIVTGIRLGLGFGWRALIAAELVAVTQGLGFMIFSAANYLRTDIILAGILVIGIVAIAMDSLILVPIERATVLRWGMYQ